MAEIRTLTRLFRYQGRDLLDPDPSLDLDGVRRVFAREYPKLTNASISAPEEQGDTVVYTLTEAVGTKG